jgi:hypothetical protein
MADKKISQLTGATTPLAGTEELPIVQSGSTVKATAEQILTSTQPSGTANGVLYLNGSKVATSGTGLRFDGTSLAVKRNRTGTFQPSFDLYANDLTISANDVFGWLNFYGNDTTSNVFTKHAFVSAVAFTTHAPGTNATELTFGTTPAGTDVAVEQVRIRATGDVRLANGNLVIGTAGKGIDFSGVGTAAEILDDYEEGTWTPTVIGSGTAGTYETSSAAGSYTKIGRQVTVNATISLAAVITGGGTGGLRVSGLPFNAADGNAYGAVMMSGVDVDNNTITLTSNTQGAGSNRVLFLETWDNASNSSVAIADVAATDAICFSLTYNT